MAGLGMFGSPNLEEQTWLARIYRLVLLHMADFQFRVDVQSKIPSLQLGISKYGELCHDLDSRVGLCG